VPLIFKFKLFAISRLDQDGDGIPYLEDLNGDGYMKSFSSTNLPNNSAMPFAM
jgi:hypothetical protein